VCDLRDGCFVADSRSLLPLSLELFLSCIFQVVPLFTYSFLTGALTLLIVTVLSLAIERTSFFSISITEGHFGWVRSEGGLIWLNILLGFLEGMIGVVVSGSGKHIQRG